MATQIKPQQHFQFFYIAAAFLGLLIVQDYLSTNGNNTQVLPYSQFLDMLHGGKLEDIVVDASRIQGTIKAPEKGKPAHFSTLRVDGELAQTLSADHVTFSGAPPPGWFSTAIGWIAPLALFWGVWFFVGKKFASGSAGGMGGGLAGCGKAARNRCFTVIGRDADRHFVPANWNFAVFYSEIPVSVQTPPIAKPRHPATWAVAPSCRPLHSA